MMDDREVLSEIGNIVGLLQLRSASSLEMKVLIKFVDAFDPELQKTPVDDQPSTSSS